MSTLAPILAQSGWSSLPLGRLAPRIQRAGRPDLPTLSVFLGEGVVPRASRLDNHNRLGEDLAKYLVVQPGDIVFNKLRTWQGGLGVSSHEGIVSPAYFVCRPRRSVEPRYLHYVLRSAPYLQELTRISKWMPPSQFDISWDQLRMLQVLHPPLSVQRAIADYLDSETVRIDALIEKKRRMVEVVRERFQVVIDAVSFSAPVSAPLKRVADISYGLGQPPPLTFEGIPIVRATNISRGRISATDLVFARVEDIPLKRAPLLMAGEILVVRSGACTGDSALIREDWAGSAPGYDLRLRPFAIDSRFLAYQLLGRAALDQIDLASGRAAQPHLNAEDLGEVIIRRGTDSTERAAADLLDREGARSDSLAGQLGTQIALIAERRDALITAAVTGELPIPGVAA